MVFRSLSGLGDAVFAFPIVSSALRFGPVIISTHYPEVFRALPAATVTGGHQMGETVLSYNRHGREPFWDEIKRAAGMPGAKFFFDYPREPLTALVGSIIDAGRTSGRALCVIAEPRAAHMHKKGRGFSMAPEVAQVQKWVTENREKFFFVAVGFQEVFKARLDGIDFDAVDKLETAEYLSLCAHADAFATQIGHLVPIAQGLRKPLKIFAPEHNLDARTAGVTVDRVRIVGIDNEVI